MRETSRDLLIRQIVDRDVSDGKGGREAKATELKKKSTRELERIWNDGEPRR